MNKIETRDAFLEMTRSFIPARTIQVACSLDLFDAIPAQGMPSRQLARKLNMNPHACELFCNALVGLGLLMKSNNLFALTSFSKEYLLSSSKNYLGYWVKHLADLMNSWICFDKTLQTGKSFKNLSEMTKDRAEARDFTLTMYTISSIYAPLLTSLVNLSSYKRMLDIGGGPGTYSIHFCKAYPQLSATILDLPTVLSVTKKIVKQYKMFNRISFLPANYNRDPIPPGFDVAFLSNIVHLESPETNIALFKKIYNALESKGMILIQDYVLNSDHTEPLDAALFSLSMLLLTDKGRCYGADEIKTWLKQAGFKRSFEVSPTPPRKTSLIYAYK